MSIPKMLDDREIIGMLKAIQLSGMPGRHEVVVAILHLIYELKALRGEGIGTAQFTAEISAIVQSLVNEALKGE